MIPAISFAETRCERHRNGQLLLLISARNPADWPKIEQPSMARVSFGVEGHELTMALTFTD